jgi:hypothetical protein
VSLTLLSASKEILTACFEDPEEEESGEPVGRRDESLVKDSGRGGIDLLTSRTRASRRRKHCAMKRSVSFFITIVVSGAQKVAYTMFRA